MTPREEKNLYEKKTQYSPMACDWAKSWFTVEMNIDLTKIVKSMHWKHGKELFVCAYVCVNSYVP